MRQEEAQEAAEAARTAISFFEPLLEELNSIWIGFVQSIPQIVLSILLVLVTWLVAALVSRGVHKAALRAHARRALADLFQTLSSIAIWIVGLLIAAMVLFPSVTDRPRRSVRSGLAASRSGWPFATRSRIFSPVSSSWRANPCARATISRSTMSAGISRK